MTRSSLPDSYQRPRRTTIIREFLRAMKRRAGRMELLFAMSRNVPGRYGQALRERVLRPHFANAGPGLLVRQGVMIRNIERISCGTNVHIGDQVFIQAGGGLTLGDCVLIGPGAKIWTQNHRADSLETPIREQGYIYKSVTIEDDCWIGANAFIMPGVHLPRGCVVAAASVVGVKAYRENQILMGNPARPIGFRGSE
jgi:acetyltransferase-like isoleucine patch superfamily enzyme